MKTHPDANRPPFQRTTGSSIPNIKVWYRPISSALLRSLTIGAVCLFSNHYSFDRPIEKKITNRKTVFKKMKEEEEEE